MLCPLKAYIALQLSAARKRDCVGAYGTHAEHGQIQATHGCSHFRQADRTPQTAHFARCAIPRRAVRTAAADEPCPSSTASGATAAVSVERAAEVSR